MSQLLDNIYICCAASSGGHLLLLVFRWTGYLFICSLNTTNKDDDCGFCKEDGYGERIENEMREERGYFGDKM